MLGSPDFATELDVMRIIKERAEQIALPVNNLDNPPLSSEVRSTADDVTVLATLEVLDDSIECPIMIVRDGRAFRLHKDLRIPQFVKDRLTIYGKGGTLDVRPVSCQVVADAYTDRSKEVASYSRSLYLHQKKQES